MGGWSGHRDETVGVVEVTHIRLFRAIAACSLILFLIWALVCSGGYMVVELKFCVVE